MTDVTAAEPAPKRKRLQWVDASVRSITDETSDTRSFSLHVPGWDTHRCGQHLDVRLTAPDGYQATRSYSVSSAPGEEPMLTVQRYEGGEVSPFLVDEVQLGDTLEVRGPIGGYFVWDPTPSRLWLLASSAGISPLRAMWRRAPDPSLITVVYEVEDLSDVIFGDELNSFAGNVSLTTDEIAQPVIDDCLNAGSPENVFVCGPTPFVERTTQLLNELLAPPRGLVRAERFG